MLIVTILIVVNVMFILGKYLDTKYRIEEMRSIDLSDYYSLLDSFTVLCLVDISILVIVLILPWVLKVIGKSNG